LNADPPHEKPVPAHGSSDLRRLKRASVGGAIANASAQGCRFLIQILAQVVMARLIAPADYGVVAMAAPLIAFAMLFRDIGLSQATVQRRDLSLEQSSSLFWLNVAVGVVLALLTLAAAPLAKTLYTDGRVTVVVMSLAPLLVMAGATAQHTALMSRHLRFRTLALVEVAGTLIGAAIGVMAAFHGYGYWSLILMQLANSASTMVGAWVLSPFRPARPCFAKSAIPLVRFGRNVTAFNLVNYFARNLDNVLIGAIFGPAKLAFYDRAYKLMTMPLAQINAPLARVTVALLARLQDNPERYEQAYFKSLLAVLFLTFPIGVIGFVAADEVIHLLLGPAWDEAAPIFAWLALGTLAAPIGSSTSWLFLSQGRTREMFLTGLVSSAIFIASFLTGLAWGPQGVAIAYIIFGYFLQGPYLLWRATQKGPVGLAHLLREIAPFFAAAAIAIVLLSLLRPWLPDGLTGLALLSIIAGITHLSVLFAIPNSRRALIGLLRDLKSMTRGGTKAIPKE
jgi:PST family polysaccharide transporter